MTLQNAVLKALMSLYPTLPLTSVTEAACFASNEEVIGNSRILGRSHSCFAVADSSLPEIMARLGPGRLIYADKA